MRFVHRSRVALTLLSSVILVGGLRAAGEPPTGDLRPLAPARRPLAAQPHMFQMYGNGSAQFSADGRTLFVANHMGLTIWDVNDPKASQPRSVRPDGNIFFHNAAVTVSPDGKTLAVFANMGGGQDMPIRFFDASTGKETRQIENDQYIQGLCYSPDGRRLAVATQQQRIELWDAVSGDEVRAFTAEANTFYRLLTFGPDGKMLAAVAMQNRFPPPQDNAIVIPVWETATGKERTRIRLAPPLPAATPNGRVYHQNQGINGLAFSVDGGMLAASGSDSTVHLWDLRSGKELAPLTVDPSKGEDAKSADLPIRKRPPQPVGQVVNAGALVFTPDGKELIGVDTAGNRLSWKVEDIRRINAVRLPSLDDKAFAALWDELARADLFRSYRAGRYLLADSARAVALMGSRLKPVPAGDTARINQLVGDLRNQNPSVRRKAMMELRAKHGEAAAGVLLQTPNPQRNPYNVTFDQKLINLYNTPERARDIRAVHLLAVIGTPEARRVLEKVAGGAAGVPLTTEAKAALDRRDGPVKGQPDAGATPEQMWTDLAGEPPQAFRAMAGLFAAPKPAVELLGKQLKPVPVVKEADLQRLLANLEADEFKTRERATEELEKVGEQAIPTIKKALSGKPSLEARKRLEGVLERLTGQVSAPLLRSLRAVEVLEHLDAPEARRVLQSLCAGAAESVLTREAKASLDRQNRQRPPAP